jgi:hypothetical protein
MESLGDTRRLLWGIPDQKVAHLASQARALDASELKKVGPELLRKLGNYSGNNRLVCRLLA